MKEKHGHYLKATLSVADGLHDDDRELPGKVREGLGRARNGSEPENKSAGETGCGITGSVEVGSRGEDVDSRNGHEASEVTWRSVKMTYDEGDGVGSKK